MDRIEKREAPGGKGQTFWWDTDLEKPFEIKPEEEAKYTTCKEAKEPPPKGTGALYAFTAGQGKTEPSLITICGCKQDLLRHSLTLLTVSGYLDKTLNNGKPPSPYESKTQKKEIIL
ncbi:MAG: hypothetical protein Q9160_007406 [Pyrenula sp. 1 TL-2023]